MEELELIEMQEKKQTKEAIKEQVAPLEWNFDCIEGIIYGYRNTQHSEEGEIIFD